MTKIVPLGLLLAVCPFSAIARADAQPALAPALAHVEIAETQGGQRAVDDHAVFVTPSGEPGEVVVNQPGGQQTRLKLRLVTHGAPGVSFEIERVASDRTSYTAKGEIALPPPGKKVLLARVPRASGPVEIWLSLAPN
ncbi:MAG TPA: hypothetical protein VFF06_05605 [Polyangia bacterium]|nr:hypothetical protein [Polyangia bacterium]